MYDDFWTGYNSGNGLTVEEAKKETLETMKQEKPRGYYPVSIQPNQQRVLGTYDKSKVIKMQGPNGEKGDIYANGKMYIEFPNRKVQGRTFPSRPWGIRYMQKRGWVLI
jgi:hypothetical protein